VPGKNKAPLLGWHPPAELSAWVRAEAQRRGVTVSVILNEAIEVLRELREQKFRAPRDWETLHLTRQQIRSRGKDSS